MSLIETFLIQISTILLTAVSTILLTAVILAILTILSSKFYPLHLLDKIRGGLYSLGWGFGIADRRIFFSPERALTGIKKLHKNIEEKSNFIPEIIVGIDGGKYVGGGIVAYLLASSRMGFGSLPVTCLELVRNANGNPIWDKCQSIFDTCAEYISERKQILIVDDMAIKGNTVEEVVNELKKRLKNIEIKISIIVIKPEAYSHFNGKSYWDAKFCCYHLKKDKKVEFPWKSEVPY